jgi:hypothetical protein
MMAGNEAMGLWVRAGSWSSAQLTNGFIPEHMAKAMANAMANGCDLDALVMAGLWDRIDGGYQFHDWADFQPDATKERNKRKARSDAGKRGAEARWGKQTDSKPDGKPIANAMANECDRNAPSRPVPSNKETPSSPATPPMEFEAFWAAYPRRVGKQAAIKAWAKAIKLTDPQSIINGAKNYANAVKGDDPKYTAHPSSWLNAGRWDDEPMKTQTPAFDPWAQEGAHA